MSSMKKFVIPAELVPAKVGKQESIFYSQKYILNIISNVLWW